MCVEIFPLGASGGAGPPIISETTRARKLNLKIPLDMVKYPFWIQKNITLYDTV